MNKICIFVNTLNSGGAEKQSILLLNALSEKNHVIFIVYHGDRVENKMLEIIEAKSFIMANLQGNIIVKLLKLYMLLKSHNVKYLFSFLTKPNIIGAIVGKFAGVDNIYSSVRNSKMQPWKIFLERIVSNYFVNVTIFNNFSGEKLFKEKGFKNTLVIPNCLPNISLPIIRDKAEKIRIITVGRFVSAKDYKTAIQAIAQLKTVSVNIVYHIVGYGKLERQIKKWILDYDMSDAIILHINPNYINEKYRQADIYLSTSLYEGTSNSIMEAMNYSLPVIATNVGDNKIMVQQGVNGFLHNVGDYKAMAQSIRTLSLDYDMRKQFGIESNRILRENYTAQKFAENYQKLIGEKR